MLKELKSSVDRHREFIMTCEAKTVRNAYTTESFRN